MKNRWVILAFSAAFLGVSQAGWSAETTLEATAEKVSEAPKAPKPMSAEEKKSNQLKREKIEKMQQNLNGSRWEVALSGTFDKKLKGDTDALIFQNNQVRSERLEKRGFTATNYTISLISEDSERAIWETMQTGKEGNVFIRGEWEKDLMQGSVIEQLDGGKKTVQYHFSNAARKIIPPTMEKKDADADKDAATEKPENAKPASKNPFGVLRAD